MIYYHVDLGLVHLMYLLPLSEVNIKSIELEKEIIIREMKIIKNLKTTLKVFINVFLFLQYGFTFN